MDSLKQAISWTSEGFFPRGQKWIFPGTVKRTFLGGKVVKFHFTHCKPRKNFFCRKFNRKMSNYEIQVAPKPPFRCPWAIY